MPSDRSPDRPCPAAALADGIASFALIGIGVLALLLLAG